MAWRCSEPDSHWKEVGVWAVHRPPARSAGTGGRVTQRNISLWPGRNSLTKTEFTSAIGMLNTASTGIGVQLVYDPLHELAAHLG